MLTYLLSKPSDWQIYMGALKNRGPDSKRIVQTTRKELIDQKYIERMARRDAETGRLNGWDYVIHEIPYTVESSPIPEPPKPETIETKKNPVPDPDPVPVSDPEPEPEPDSVLPERYPEPEPNAPVDIEIQGLIFRNYLSSELNAEQRRQIMELISFFNNKQSILNQLDEKIGDGTLKSENVIEYLTRAIEDHKIKQRQENERQEAETLNHAAGQKTINNPVGYLKGIIKKGLQPTAISENERETRVDEATETKKTLNYPVQLNLTEKSQIEKILKNNPEAQKLLDVLGQVMATVEVHNPVGYLVGMVKKWKMGEFVLTNAQKEATKNVKQAVIDDCIYCDNTGTIWLRSPEKEYVTSAKCSHNAEKIVATTIKRRYVITSALPGHQDPCGLDKPPILTPEQEELKATMQKNGILGGFQFVNQRFMHSTQFIYKDL